MLSMKILKLMIVYQEVLLWEARWIFICIPASNQKMRQDGFLIGTLHLYLINVPTNYFQKWQVHRWKYILTQMQFLEQYNCCSNSKALKNKRWKKYWIEIDFIRGTITGFTITQLERKPHEKFITPIKNFLLLSPLPMSNPSLG